MHNGFLVLVSAFDRFVVADLIVVALLILHQMQAQLQVQVTLLLSFF